VNISVVIGNPRPGGRTTVTARAVAGKVAEAVGGAGISIFELGEHTRSIFSWDAPAVQAINATVARSDLAVFACPTYKASFTGLLKAFLDRYPGDGLAGVVAVPVMLGAAPIHALAPETQLRPVLVELAASVPTKAFFMLDTDMDGLAAAVDRWWNLAERPLMRSLGC
jgi:FMN reductase